MATEENLYEMDIKILKLLQQNSRLTSEGTCSKSTPLPFSHLSNGRNDWSVRDTSSDMGR